MGELVPIRKTPWAKPMDHHEICVNMDAILRAEGVEEAHVRRRLTAHAIVACGWRQLCYNFNVWKCKLGGWDGDYYSHDTLEEKGGLVVKEKGTKWRSYGSYGEALADYRVWPLSRYAAAKAVLLDPEKSDREFGAELQAAGYWTASSGTDLYAGVAARVGRELEAEGGSLPIPFDEAAGAAAIGAGVWVACTLGLVGVVLIGVGVYLMKRGKA